MRKRVARLRGHETSSRPSRPQLTTLRTAALTVDLGRVVSWADAARRRAATLPAFVHLWTKRTRPSDGEDWPGSIVVDVRVDVVIFSCVSLSFQNRPMAESDVTYCTLLSFTYVVPSHLIASHFISPTKSADL